MNYSKKSTSRKQKALKGKGTKMGKKLGVVFMKTLLVPVSYTHLDVYKRQGADKAGSEDGEDRIYVPVGRSIVQLV